MVYYCFIKSCKNSTYRDKKKSCEERVTWHGLPIDRESQQKWARSLGVENIPKSSRICSKHFSSDCFEQTGLSKRRLKSNAVPLLHINSTAQSGALQDAMEENNSAIANTDTFEPPNKELKIDSIAPLCLHSLAKSEEPQKIPQDTTHEDNNVLTKTPTKSTANSIRYPGDITEEKVMKMSPRTIVQSIHKLKKSCKDKDIRIKRLHRLHRCQQKKIETMQQLLTDLRKSNLISPNAYDVLEAMTPDDRNIADDIRKGKVKGKYPAHLRSFALTLHFYSPRAYNYVRQAYQNKLPAPSTIRSWYSNTNGSPGITKEALDALKHKQENAPEKRIYACLMTDEMAIRRQAEWNHPQKRFVGYVDFGTLIPEPENMPLAKEALVYLVNGVNERWKIPVAYFLVQGLTAEERAEITRQVLISIAATGISIIALTFDGLPANIAMCLHFAADVYNNKPYFLHPSDENLKVRIIFDAAHMAKLIRNAFASKRILYDQDNNPIEWKYIEKLVEIQENSCYHLANKVSRNHLQWEKNKMSVKLATQTLSESVAVALKQLLEDGHEYFTDCAATIKFILMVKGF